jgi:nucleoside phosphorylase
MATADGNPNGCVLAIAAERREFQGLLQRAAPSKPLPLPLDYAVETQVGSRPWVLVANGPGSRRAGDAARAALSWRQPAAILSTGYCGGLVLALRASDIFVASEVIDLASGRRFPAASPHSNREHATGPLVSIDRVASTVREKRALAKDGAMAVEMEAGAVAVEAERTSIPFYCVRAISDTASENLPLDFNRYRDTYGRFDRKRIALSALFRPAAARGLLKLDSACRKASENLGEFLVHCRF